MSGSIAALVLTAAAITGSPGPATMSLVAASSTFGARRSLRYFAGIVAGTVAVLLAVAAGIAAVLLAVPGLGTALTVVSVAYIVWLAYRIATAPPASPAAGARAPSLRGGLILGVANPKAWIALAAVFAGAHVGAALKLAVISGMIVASSSTWLAAGRSLAPLLRRPHTARIVNRMLAAALLAASALAFVR
jgi:threonine/homoserine/homoserine lactone efflux protein